MKEKEKRIASMQKELMGMYETLFGATYIPGLQDGQKEFNLIIEKFNEKMFAIRQDQDERSKR